VVVTLTRCNTTLVSKHPYPYTAVSDQWYARRRPVGPFAQSVVDQGNQKPLSTPHNPKILNALGQVSSRLGGFSGLRMSLVKTLIPLVKNGRISLISMELSPESYARIRHRVDRKEGG
jgi:hypothetical protein